MELIVKGQFVQITDTATVVLSEIDAKFEMFRINDSTEIHVNRSRSVMGFLPMGMHINKRTGYIGEVETKGDR